MIAVVLFIASLTAEEEEEVEKRACKTCRAGERIDRMVP